LKIDLRTIKVWASGRITMTMSSKAKEKKPPGKEAPPKEAKEL
jgi:hypothetical protein